MPSSSTCGPQPIQSPTGPPQRPPARRPAFLNAYRHGAWRWGGAVVLVLVLIVTGLVVVSRPSHRVVSDFSKAIELMVAKDAEAAQDYVDFLAIPSKVSRHMNDGPGGLPSDYESEARSYRISESDEGMFLGSKMVAVCVAGTAWALENRKASLPFLRNRAITAVTVSAKTAYVTIEADQGPESQVTITWQLVKRGRHWILTDISHLLSNGEKRW